MTSIETVPGTRRSHSHLWWSVRPFVTLAVLFAIVLGVLTLAGALNAAAAANIVALAVGLCFLQWTIAPAIVQWAIPARQIEHDGERYLTNDPIGAIVARRCRDAGVRLVRLGVVDDGTPNAFAFGRTRRDARVYVTRGLLERLNDDELDAVIAHELGHIRHRDFVLMTIAMVVPLALYTIGRALIDADDSDDDDGDAALLGIAVLVLWIVSEFVVLWLSRTRELAADHWACECTGKGDALASALVKVSYGMAVNQSNATSEAHQVSSKSDSKQARKEKRREERRAHCMETLGILDQGAVGNMANGFVGGLDVHRAVAAVRWEAHNPWARVLEKTSTHPLVGRRIAALQASGLPGRPTWPGVDVARAAVAGSEMLRLRLAFVADVSVVVLPWSALVTSIVLLSVGLAPLFAAGLLACSGVLFAVAQVRRYPFPHAEVDEVTSLLDRIDASPVRGIAVEVRGRIVGRDAPGYLLGSDLVVEDRSGLVALDYRQPIPFASAIFGFRRAEHFVGQDVVVRGWYRRTPQPAVELRELRAVDGQTVRPRLWIARFVAAGAIVVAGLVATAVQLATIGGA